MKQTAVEWLIEQLTEVDYNCINKTFLQSNNSLAGYKMRELFEKAKEMEKEQIKNMYSEEDLREAFKQSRQCKIFEKDMPPVYETFEDWFEQFKKK
jgi:hypothetical protein